MAASLPQSVFSWPVVVYRLMIHNFIKTVSLQSNNIIKCSEVLIGIVKSFDVHGKQCIYTMQTFCQQMC